MEETIPIPVTTTRLIKGFLGGSLTLRGLILRENQGSVTGSGGESEAHPPGCLRQRSP